MNKILLVQSKLLNKINQYKHIAERDYPIEWEKIHMASCAKIGLLLAAKRNIEPEMAAIACSLHDYGRIVTGKQAYHAVNGYEPVKEFLAEIGLFTNDEIEKLAQAVKNHSNKHVVGTPLEEIVKDADVLDCYQYGDELERPEQRERLKKVIAELGYSELS
ncbi:metal dependent phosphohydrolase [Thermosinus carboxydivorans Nor1]|uniref:Metal dependent phosphohydrolase n=1 Tax=Thermosinus carboxydivorans Nor1 TaxID=401526 RepID=A1HNN5_9FIRM|nr:HD domain-containing protein [Thermosinus carboxydivorans]EAX48394.1 metal dependent phosphohydrolase [Thermosinus carboxydivorans Nor1]